MGRANLSPAEHRTRHMLLHQALDELVADFIRHTDSLPSKTTVMELMDWSAKQTREPDELKRA
jgi:hypothetical protein